MDISKLNEELESLIINELSNDTVNNSIEGRKDLERNAEIDYVNGRGSLEKLKQAREKRLKNRELVNKRNARRSASLKHTIILPTEHKSKMFPISDLDSLEDFEYIKTNWSFYGISDETLIKIANFAKENVEELNTITTIEEAKNIFNKGLNDLVRLSIYVSALSGIIENDIHGTASTRASVDRISKESSTDVLVIVDKLPEEVIKEIDAIKDDIKNQEEKNRKLLNKFSTNIKKGKIVDISYEEDVDFICASYSLIVKNPFDSYDAFEKYIDEARDIVYSSMDNNDLPVPEPRIDDKAFVVETTDIFYFEPVKGGNILLCDLLARCDLGDE